MFSFSFIFGQSEVKIDGGKEKIRIVQLIAEIRGTQFGFFYVISFTRHPLQ